MPRNLGGMLEEHNDHNSGKSADHGHWRPLVLAGSAFALGVIAAPLLTRAARGLQERVRGARSHDDYEQTVEYDQNLPEALGRREPAPEPGQPRYGGTGSLGVHPASGIESSSTNRPHGRDNM
jgi:hypothetical protein